MKLLRNARLSSGQRRAALGVRAFTITEILVAMAVFLMMILGVLTVHIFGLKMNQLVSAKMGASDEARRAISKMVSEIRSAGIVRIGTGSKTTFTEATGLQQGNSIQVFPSKTNKTDFIRYYWDSTDKRLKRSVNNGAAVLVVANSITNSMVFTAENFAGTVNTDNQNNRVIGMTLQFYQLEYPTVPIGPGAYYDFYQLRAKITRRALE